MFDYYLNDYPVTFPSHTSDGPGFEEMLALAAQQFPLTDSKPVDNRVSYAHFAPSPFTGSSSSGSSSAMSPLCYDSGDHSGDGSDSDVEPLSLDHTDDLFDRPPRTKSPYVHFWLRFSFRAYTPVDLLSKMRRTFLSVLQLLSIQVPEQVPQAL